MPVFFSDDDRRDYLGLLFEQGAEIRLIVHCLVSDAQSHPPHCGAKERV